MERRCCLFTVLLAVIFAVFSSSIEAKDKPAKIPNVPVFRSDARIVLVDVVATDSKGHPVHGLKNQDFQVFDDGKRQTIRAFDEHTPDGGRTAPIEKPPVLGAGIYTNWTPTNFTGATNIILFDTLNLDSQFQADARKQMVKYLRTLPPGQRVALFTLGSRLRMVQGITGNSDALIAAAQKLGALSGFRVSDADSQRALLDGMGSAQVSTGSAESAAGASLQTPAPGIHTPEAILRDFLNAETTQIADVRMRITLAALRDLARALGPIPGRKNLIWVAGEFPALIGSYTEMSGFHLYDREIRTTAALLAAHQVAVYPIDARGLLTESGRELFVTQVAMDELAEQTGGRAFYNSNAISDAFKQSMDSGASYYTLSYVPTNKKWDGKLRKIEVKLARQNVKLTYRRGYYAVADPFAPVLKIKTTKDDVQRRLIEAVQPGAQPSSSIFVKAKAVATGADKPVEIDYIIDARNLTLAPNDDGTQKVSYQVVAVAWDKTERNAAQAWEMVDKHIDSQHAAEILRKGIKSRRFLALKPGTYDLYLGVIDVESKKIGSLVVPLEIAEGAKSSGLGSADVHGEMGVAPSVGLGSIVASQPTSTEQDEFEGSLLDASGPQESSLFVTSSAGEQTSGPHVEALKSDSPEVSDDGVYTFRTAAQEVLVDATVRDNKKRLIPDLKKQDFRIIEDGVEQRILGFSYDQLPLAVALVLDRSGSMQKNVIEMQKTAAQVLSGLKPQDKVALFAFDWSVEKMVDLTTDRNQVANAIGNVKAGDSTDMVNALFVATLYLKEHAPNSRRVIIVVSDNKAFPFTVLRNSDVRTETDLIDTALYCETAIYSLRMPNHEARYRAAISMDKITEQTGGEMISSSSTGQMLSEVVGTLRTRYVLSFKPSQDGSDGRMHTIELKLVHASTDSVHYRRGYRSPNVRNVLNPVMFRTEGK